jgi:hypothetical protein
LLSAVGVRLSTFLAWWWVPRKVPKMMKVTPFEKLVAAPLVSAPERAFLELLSEVGGRQPLQEARELAESMYTLRADVLEDLPTGSNRPWVSRSKDGLLVLKP